MSKKKWMLAAGFIAVVSSGSAYAQALEGSDKPQQVEEAATERKVPVAKVRAAVPKRPATRVSQSPPTEVKSPPSSSAVTPPASLPASAKALPSSDKVDTTSAAPTALIVNPAGEFQPVVHARNSNITTCMDSIVTDSNEVIDRPHTAISTWVTASPNEHSFGSLIGLSQPSKLSPNSAAFLLAVPRSGNACEGVTVQVFPSAQPCGTIQASLIKVGRTVGNLQSMPVVDTNDGARNLLLPNGSGGCVLVRTKIKAS